MLSNMYGLFRIYYISIVLTFVFVQTIWDGITHFLLIIHHDHDYRHHHRQHTHHHLHRHYYHYHHRYHNHRLN